MADNENPDVVDAEMPEDTVDDPPPAAMDHDPRPADSPASPAAGRPILAIVALLLALAALALAAVVWTQRVPPDTEAREALAGRVSELAETRQALERRMQAQADLLEQLGERLDQMDALPLQALNQRPWEASETEILAALDELERRTGRELGALRSRLDELGVADTDLDRQMQLLETQALLRMAQDRLELGDDRRGALHALQRAAARLDAVDEPRLGAARRELAREIEGVTAWRPPDRATLAGRVRGLAEQVDQWPLHARTEAAITVAEPDAAGDSRLGRIGAALRRLVTIRRTDEFSLRPDEIDALRQELRQRLGALEIALARGDEPLLQDQAAVIIHLLDEHFDTADGRVNRARDSLREIVASAVAVDRPELGGALRRLETLDPGGA